MKLDLLVLNLKISTVIPKIFTSAIINMSSSDENTSNEILKVKLKVNQTDINDNI